MTVTMSGHGIAAVFLLLCSVALRSEVAALTAVNGTLEKVNTDVTVQCQGVPIGGEVEWKRGATTLANSDKYKVVSADGSSALTVHSTGEGDVGIYTCNVKDTQINVDVQLLSKPVVTKLDKSVAVNEGDTLELKCQGWGWPTPYTLWTREEVFNHIYGESDLGVTIFNVTSASGMTLDDRAGLRIEHLNSTDQMTYMCLMVNEIGVTNTTTYVRVKDRHAALWPFIGIIIILILLIILIIVGETIRRRSNKIDEAKSD